MPKHSLFQPLITFFNLFIDRHPHQCPNTYKQNSNHGIEENGKTCFGLACIYQFTVLQICNNFSSICAVSRRNSNACTSSIKRYSIRNFIYSFISLLINITSYLFVKFKLAVAYGFGQSIGRSQIATYKKCDAENYQNYLFVL